MDPKQETGTSSANRTKRREREREREESQPQEQEDSRSVSFTRFDFFCEPRMLTCAVDEAQANIDEIGDKVRFVVSIDICML